MRPLIHLVADYGPGDLAFAEVVQRLDLELPRALVVSTPVPPFDTISCGFCVAQLALTEGPAERVVLHNVAPRRDSPSPREGNAGESFVVCELPDDVLVVGPNAGHALSFVAPEARSMRLLDAPTAGSQFRSRDFVPAALGRLLGGDRGALGEAVPPGAVPPAPDRAVVYVDGYGNLKTSWHEAPAEPGERVVVRIGQRTATAIVSDGTFSVAEGELAFAPGSSGWIGRRGRRCFYELLLRGGSAAERFGRPPSGSPVEVEPVDTSSERSPARAGGNGQRRARQEPDAATHIEEIRLPGIGLRHDVTTSDGRRIGMVTYRDGRRELLIYDDRDPDECHTRLVLSEQDAETLAELLGASEVIERLAELDE